MRALAQKPSALAAAVLCSLLPLVAVVASAVSADRAAAGNVPTAFVSDAPPPFDLAAVDADVLWLARCLYSETKQPHEQELVAWVIRNRVETAYRGQRTYEGVVLDPFQFSAFNAGGSKRALYSNLRPESASAGWHRALEIAHRVYHAPASARPFPAQTRHFYSERSMVGRSAPVWSDGKRPVQPVGSRVDPRRFRFYSGIAQVLPL